MIWKSFLYAFIAVVLHSTALAADDFVLSFWCAPPAGEDINRRYAEVAECGFNYAMYPCSGRNSQAILDACQKNKLKYIVSDSRVLTYAPNDAAFKTNLDALISAYSQHPAYGGFLLVDEPDHSMFAHLGAVHQYMLEKEPKSSPLINLLPNYAPEAAFGGTYEQYVDNFATTVKPRMLCFDHYGLMSDGTLRPIYFENLEVMRRQSLKHGIPFGFIFQLTAHGSYRDPTEEELRWQVNTGLAYGAKALFYFTYWTPTADPLFKDSVGIIDARGKRSPHYERVKRINKDINTWAPTLMKLKSLSVYHIGELPSGTHGPVKDPLVRASGKGNFIISEFKHEDGSEWIMVMNRGMREAGDIVLQLDPAMQSVEELSLSEGKLVSAKVSDHRLALQLPAGSAKLFKLGR
jgi:hypothetical protein